MDYKGIGYLRTKLESKRPRVQIRYKYYEMKNQVSDSFLTPENFQGLKEVIGWCAKAVDTLADRIVFDRFEHDDFMLNQIFNFNSQDIFVDSSILSALVSSCSFIYISADENGYPRLQVIDGGNATGILDPITTMLTEGYAVIERDKQGLPEIEAYFTKEETQFYYKGQREPEIIQNPAPYALLVPIINRPDAVRPFGHSRISRACMQLTQTALHTLKRSEISAEFYSFPQKYVLGLSEEAEFNNRLASMSSFLRIDKDSEHEKPTVGQFQQQSMAPYMEQLKCVASLFAAETGLTLDDLGFTTNNPMSAEAIKASHESLRLTARKAQRTFGSGLLNTGYLAACVRDGVAYERKSFCNTVPTWEPIFEPDSAALGALGDAIFKINQVVPEYLDRSAIRRMTGIEGNINE